MIISHVAIENYELHHVMFPTWTWPPWSWPLSSSRSSSCRHFRWSSSQGWRLGIRMNLWKSSKSVLTTPPFFCKTNNTNIRDLPGQLENLSFSSFSPGSHCGLAQESHSRGLGMCWQANTIDIITMVIINTIVIITMVIDNLDAIAAFLKSIPTPTAFSISS